MQTSPNVLAVFNVQQPDSAGNIVATTRVRLEYRSTDPAVVIIHFPRVEESPVWTVGRALLYQGCIEYVGEGDVRLTPTPDANRLHIQFSTPEGSAALLFPFDRVSTFLEETYSLVPRASEDQLVSRALEAQLASMCRS